MISSFVFLLLMNFGVGPGSVDDDDFFEKQVRPVLVERCLKCHGDEAKPKGGLKLTSRAALLKGGDTGVVVVEGKPEESLLIEAVRYRDVLLQMPPKDKLSDAEVAVLEKWVSRGVPWPNSQPVETTLTLTPAARMVPSQEQREFWAFQPVRSPAIPPGKPVDGPGNAIDGFVRARLEAAGIQGAAPADKHTLIRRATFDLTGLPPTTEEVDAFENDTSDIAFEKVVERLLASPAYGERWARHWLDVVRYADSLDARGSGQPGDILDAWRYRDWVVDALNQDMPYDRFVQMQIAGDLLPSDDATECAEGFNRAGTIATTMLAIGNWGNGDADKDKILTDIADDQVDVVSKAFMGLTVSCARCHDHKFDPISQRDYYGLAGIFFSTHILPNLTPKGAGETIIRVPLASPAEIGRRATRERRLAELEKQIGDERTQAAAAFATRMKPQAGRYLMGAWDYLTQRGSDNASPLETFAGERSLEPILLRQWSDFLGGGTLRALDVRNEGVGGRAGVLSWTAIPEPQASATANTLGEELTIATFRLPARSISVHPGPASHALVSWRSPIAGKVRVSGRVADGDPQCGNGIAWAIDHVSLSVARGLATGEVANGAAMSLGQGKGADKLASLDVRPGDRVDFIVMRNGEYSCDTTTVELVISSWNDSQTWDLTRDCLDDFLSANPHPDRLGNKDVWTFADSKSERGADSSELELVLTEWRKAVAEGAPRSAIEHAAHTLAEKFDLADSRSPFWISDERGEALLEESARSQLAALRTELTSLRSNPPPALEFANAAQEGGVPESPHAGTHDVAIHMRGRYDRLGELVPRGYPEILVNGSPEPIKTGSGRVELAHWLTTPGHPLTSRVIANRVWQHHFGAGLVRTPSNFGKLGDRPSHPELLDYLAQSLVEKGWSLKALHREIMLSASYQQASVPSDEAARLDADNRLFSRQNRKRLEAEALRDALLAVSGRLDPKRGGPAERNFNVPLRGLYMITIRSDRATFGSLFDQADSTAPVEARVESTVAPQALFLMNNAFVREQAKGLAEISKTARSEPDTRVKWLYGRLYGRAPNEREMMIGRRLVQADSVEAWESYCHTLMCTNEFLYVD
jgi:hypothetical protein